MFSDKCSGLPLVYCVQGMISNIVCGRCATLCSVSIFVIMCMLLIHLVKSSQRTKAGVCGEQCLQYEYDDSVRRILARAECSNNVFPLKRAVSCEIDKVSADI